MYSKIHASNPELFLFQLKHIGYGADMLKYNPL
jgi:hypothetical protein